MKRPIEVASTKSMSAKAGIAPALVGKCGVRQKNGQRDAGLHNADIAPLRLMECEVIPKHQLSRELCTPRRSGKVHKPRLNS